MMLHQVNCLIFLTLAQHHTIFALQIELLYMFLDPIKKFAGDCSFSIAAPKLWNALPASLANTSFTTTFKKHLKTHLFV